VHRKRVSQASELTEAIETVSKQVFSRSVEIALFDVDSRWMKLELFY